MVFADATLSVVDAEGKIRPAASETPRTVKAVRLAATDAAVAKVLRLMAADDAYTWVGMYRIHEVIEHALGGETPMKKMEWGSTADLKRFKHSANSVTVGGDEARHGKELEQPPKFPMNLDEADAYLRYVVQAWLTSKGI